MASTPSNPPGSATSSDAEDVSTCESSSEDSPETTTAITSSSDDDHERTPSQIRTQGRKRVRRSQNWFKNARKRRRNTGKRYVSDSTNKMVTPKRPSKVSCKCARRCFEEVSEDTRKGLFDQFWKAGNFDLQNAYLCGCVKALAPKRKYTKSEQSRRHFSRVFYVQNGGVSERICKGAFLSIFAISNGRLERALKAQESSSGVIHQDQRGRHTPHNKTSRERLEGVKEHIEKFPCYESHYSRKSNPNRKYLSPTLSVPKMYRLYKDYSEENGLEPVSEWKYREVFKTTFNLSFGRPKSDTCKTCDSLHTRLAAEENAGERLQLEGELQLHKCKAERAYQQLKEDAALSRSSPEVDMFTFDLQQSLPTPKLSTSVVFYKRQMWTYNFGIHECASGKGYMYVWPESIASRGSQEIASSLLKHFSMASSQASHLIVFSDACGGQNRNINIACFWMYIVGNRNFKYKLVDHKFMISGHSYLPNDRDFGSIEKANRKTQHVFVPDDWCNLIENARHKNPFVVTKMATSDFFSIGNVKSQIVHRKTNTHKEKVDWLSIRWLQIRAEKPYEIYYRYSHNNLEVWKVLDVRKKRPGRPMGIGRMQLTPLYSAPRPLNTKKYEDLRQLMQFIPPVYHEFYESLEQASNNISSSEDED